jgi:hypothetical protein
MEKDVESFLLSSAMNHAADYAQRGRLFAVLSQEQLTEKWIAAFREMARDPLDSTKRAYETELASEFELRNLERPFDLVREETKKYMSAVDRAIEQKKKEDPADYERMSEDLERDISTYRADRNKSS